jgi:hypothetical protein
LHSFSPELKAAGVPRTESRAGESFEVDHNSRTAFLRSMTAVEDHDLITTTPVSRLNPGALPVPKTVGPAVSCDVPGMDGAPTSPPSAPAVGNGRAPGRSRSRYWRRTRPATASRRCRRRRGHSCRCVNGWRDRWRDKGLRAKNDRRSRPCVDSPEPAP